jgi:hypothetical protein
VFCVSVVFLHRNMGFVFSCNRVLISQNKTGSTTLRTQNLGCKCVNSFPDLVACNLVSAAIVTIDFTKLCCKNNCRVCCVLVTTHPRQRAEDTENSAACLTNHACAVHTDLPRNGRRNSAVPIDRFTL